MIWGVGQATRASLEKAGILSFTDLLRWEKADLTARFGSIGERLWHLARGQDKRQISAHTPIKSISNETTFFEDTTDPDILDGHLWRMAEKVADRAKAKHLAGMVIVLKLKRKDHSLITRRKALRDATQLADKIYRTARSLFDQVEHKGPFRLIGTGLAHLCSEENAERSEDLLDPKAAQRGQAERATDQIRARFGAEAILKADLWHGQGRPVWPPLDPTDHTAVQTRHGVEALPHPYTAIDRFQIAPRAGVARDVHNAG